MTKDPVTQRVTHATWWSAIEISVRYGVQFAVTIILARFLTPVDFGLMAMLMVFVSFSALLVEGGLGSALIQKPTTSANDETSVFWVNLGMSCVLVLLLWLLAPDIAMFYAQPALVPLLQVLLWILPLGALATVPNALLSKRLAFRKRAIAELVASVASALLALWLVWQEFGVWCLIWQALVAAALRAGLLWWLSGWRIRGRFDPAALGGLFRFGGFLLLANALNLVSVRLQALLIGKSFEARELGFYVIAQDTQQAPAQFMSSLLNRVGLPVFASVARQPEKLAGALFISLRLSMFVFVPCMAGIAVVAPPLVKLLYGPQWTEVAPILSVLALAALFWPLHVLNLAALSALGRSDLVLRLEIVKGIVSIPLVAVASFFSVLAVAWAVLVSSVLCVLINTWHSERLFGCGLIAQLRELLPGFLLTLIAGAVMWFVTISVEPFVLGMGIALAASAATYTASAAVFQVSAWRDLLKFLGALFGKRTTAQGNIPG